MGVPRDRLQLRNTVYLERFLHFPDPCGRCVRLNGVTEWSKWSTSNSNGTIGPILDTTKPTIAASEITTEWLCVYRIRVYLSYYY